MATGVTDYFGNKEPFIISFLKTGFFYVVFHFGVLKK